MSPTVKKVKKTTKKPVKRARVVRKDRQNVGARNPYALADAVLGERQKWQRMAAARKKAILEEALRRPYEELFDPVYGSPLFPSAVVGNLAGSEVLAQAGGPASASIVQWGCVDSGSYFKDPKSNRGYLQDPVQGGVPNCYLIAACTAIAWVSPQLIPNQPGPSYNYTFWNMRDDKANRSVSTDCTLPLDAGGHPVFGSCTDPHETWLPIVEKAYGIVKGLEGSEIGHPNWDRDAGGNPATALEQIAKAINAGYAATTVSTAGLTWAQLYATIYTKFEPANNNCLNLAVAKTKFPMVAKTHVTAPAGVSYSSDTIVANHAYAVLGLFKSGNKCFIVLRNPYGPTAGDPNLAASLATGTWNIPTSKYYLKGGAVNNAIPADSYSVNLADNDGTFALDTAVFMTHFQTLGYLN